MGKLKRILRFLLKCGLISGAAAFLAFALWLVFFVKIFELPNFDPYLNYQPYQTSYFVDREGEIIGCLAKEWRDPIFAQEAKELTVAKIILAVEDRRFYERPWGVDAKAIGRAFIKNIMAGYVVEGGSTLEQQLVKHLLRPEERSARNLGRKIKEAVMAFQLISRFEKDQILALYLSEVYFGGDSEGLIGQVYGVEAASRYYFNKRAGDLTLSEAALLAGIIPAPARFSPKVNLKGALEKRNQALLKAYEEGVISKEDYDNALSEPINVTGDFALSCQRAQHAVWEARKILRREHKLYFDADELESDEAKTEKTQLESSGQNYARMGLRVVTTLDWEVQRLATEGVKLALNAYKERQKENALPDAEGAFIALENGTNAIMAMVGSSDYGRSQFNHAVSSNRQIGSTFKPVVYAALFEEELAMRKQRETILDLKISNGFIDCPGAKPGERWQPKNYDEEKFGKQTSFTRRFAIAQSINKPAVHAAERGRCELHPRVIMMAEKLGIKRESLETKREIIDPKTGSTKIIAERPRLPIALGAGGVPIIDVAKFFSVFINKGVRREPYLIDKIYDAKGGLKYEKKTWESKQVITEDLANVMVEALRGVVKFGTARSIDAISQPAACKTGTTDRFTDTLLTCFTPHVVVSAWIGGSKDNASSLGDKETGARTAGPAVKYVLQKWYEGYAPTSFQEEVEGWSSIIVDPSAFQKEMESLKNSDPDTEAPQE